MLFTAPTVTHQQVVVVVGRHGLLGVDDAGGGVDAEPPVAAPDVVLHPAVDTRVIVLRHQLGRGRGWYN